MEIKELKKRSAEELKRMETQLREELRQLHFDLASAKVKNVKKMGEIRKTIARIMTLKKLNK
ncbi:MAG: 50S ribosomal protein L29 [Candidatus Paceibacterota bacterium]|jgi:large subunit ribosomal protein L29|nr:50S ribosomal protein L29 [Candidatus Paceibacterota bacterium]MDD5621068.1 50S ribosomal protein L29 [Candidatus Paceibacterota bacterium]